MKFPLLGHGTFNYGNYGTCVVNSMLKDQTLLGLKSNGKTNMHAWQSLQKWHEPFQQVYKYISSYAMDQPRQREGELQSPTSAEGSSHFKSSFRQCRMEKSSTNCLRRPSLEGQAGPESEQLAQSRAVFLATAHSGRKLNQPCLPALGDLQAGAGASP